MFLSCSFSVYWLLSVSVCVSLSLSLRFVRSSSLSLSVSLPPALRLALFPPFPPSLPYSDSSPFARLYFLFGLWSLCGCRRRVSPSISRVFACMDVICLMSIQKPEHCFLIDLFEATVGARRNLQESCTALVATLICRPQT